MNLTDLLNPVRVTAAQHAADGSLGAVIRRFGEDFDATLPEGTVLALFSVPEDRCTGHGGEAAAPARVREALYALSSPMGDRTVADLGELKPGVTLNDTYCAVEMLASFLRERHVTAVLVGGSADVAYGALLPAERHERFIHWASVHPHVFPEDYRLSDQVSPLSRLLWHPDRNLECTLVGGQQYFSSAAEWAHVQENFDVIRLGMARADLEAVEPYLRDSNVVSFSMTAVRHADAPETSFVSPNGFAAEEACRLGFFAGTAPHGELFALCDMVPGSAQPAATDCLAAQVIWHYMQGCALRVDEHPLETPHDFQKYIVSLDRYGQALHFMKSLRTGRWWIALPAADDAPPVMVACSQRDYDRACHNELPSRWCKPLRR